MNAVGDAAGRAGRRITAGRDVGDDEDRGGEPLSPDSLPRSMTPADAIERRTATRVVLSYPADLGRHGRSRIEQEYYKKYLRKTRDDVAVGDAWEEFTDVGCCGSRMDVPFRVEAVEGGDQIGPETTIEYVEREACGVNPGWSVQHDEPGGAGG